MEAGLSSSTPPDPYALEVVACFGCQLQMLDKKHSSLKPEEPEVNNEK